MKRVPLSDPAIQRLLEAVGEDLLPQAHTSSHWRAFGEQTKVLRAGDYLELEGMGFGEVDRSRSTVLPGLLGRWLYRSASSQWEPFGEIWAVARQLADELDFALMHAVWKQAVVLAVLEAHWATEGISPRVVALIGDGWGFLGALIARRHPTAVVYCIDLPSYLFPL